MEKGRGETMDGTKQSYQKNIRNLGEKQNYKYLGILEAKTIKQTEMKEKVRKKKNIKRMRKLLKTMLCSRNLIKGIDT